MLLVNLLYLQFVPEDSHLAEPQLIADASGLTEKFQDSCCEVN